MKGTMKSGMLLMLMMPISVVCIARRIGMLSYTLLPTVFLRPQEPSITSLTIQIVTFGRQTRLDFKITSSPGRSVRSIGWRYDGCQILSDAADNTEDWVEEQIEDVHWLGSAPLQNAFQHFDATYSAENFLNVFCFMEDYLDVEKSSDLGKYYCKSQSNILFRH